MIDTFTFGRFVILGQPYTTNIIIMGDRVKKARYLTNHKLVLDDFKEIILYHPEFVVIGTGTSGALKPPAEILEALKKNHIKVVLL